jgi:hypothetical protein
MTDTKKITNKKEKVTLKVKEKGTDQKEIEYEFEVPADLDGVEATDKKTFTKNIAGVKVKKDGEKDFVAVTGDTVVEFEYIGGYLYDQIQVKKVGTSEVEGEKRISAYSSFLA